MSCAALFSRRAALAFTIGQAERAGQPVPPGALRRERIVQRQLARAVIDALPPVSLAPEWCTLCGSATERKHAGHLMCVACEVQIAHGQAIDRLRTLPYECPETDE